MLYSRVFTIIDLIDYRVSQITVSRVVLGFESRDAVESVEHTRQPSESFGSFNTAHHTFVV